MGHLFRCYWLPALLAEELPETIARRSGQAPLRRLVAFRDSEAAMA